MKEVSQKKKNLKSQKRIIISFRVKPEHYEKFKKVFKHPRRKIREIVENYATRRL